MGARVGREFCSSPVPSMKAQGQGAVGKGWVLGMWKDPRRANCFLQLRTQRTPTQHVTPLANPHRAVLWQKTTWWGCHLEGAPPGWPGPGPYPPGVALLQGCALGLRRILYHASCLPRKIHCHEGVLGDTALKREGHGS